jgi:hypothetical protein
MRILGGYAHLVIASEAKQSNAARQFFTVTATDIGR